MQVYMDTCYLTSTYPFQLVYLSIFDESISEYDVLQGLYFLFRYRVLALGGLALHAAVVEKNGIGIAFAGFSGAGKSTQAALWKKYQNAIALNLDKPAVFFENGYAFICGTPWSGKEYAYVNSEVILKTIVFPIKAKENSIERMTIADSVNMLLQNNLVYPLSDRISEDYIQRVEMLAHTVPSIRLYCTISESAVRVLYEYLFNNEYRKCERRMQMKIKSDYLLRNIAEEWIVIPRGENALHFSATIVLNETGAYLWRRLKEHHMVDELIDDIRSEYGIDRETAERDVNAFIERLKEEGVVELLEEERIQCE